VESSYRFVFLDSANMIRQRKFVQARGNPFTALSATVKKKKKSNLYFAKVYFVRDFVYFVQFVRKIFNLRFVKILTFFALFNYAKFGNSISGGKFLSLLNLNSETKIANNRKPLI